MLFIRATIITLNLITLTQQYSTEQTCSVILNNIVDSCQYSGVNLEYDHLPYQLMRSNDTRHTCRVTNYICREDFKITRLHTQTFADIFDKIVLNMVSRCCGDCANLTVVKKINNFSDVLNQSSDFVYPVLGKTTHIDMYGYGYLPVLEVQDAYYFSLRHSNTALIRKVMGACFEMWPLLVIVLIMAVLSGFVIWVLEMRVNAAEFPPSFCTGVYQGFWWSFISMTTVGYGDAYPRSLVGRLYAVMWIITGITLCSIFTASMTAHITKARDVTASSDMGAKKVGVLKGRLEDELMVIQLGGVPYEVEYNRTVQGIFELTDRLEQKQIDGFLLNKDTFQFLSRRIKRKEYANLLKKLEEKIQKSFKKFSEEEFSFGLLIRNKSDHVFFRKYLRYNRVLIDSCHVMEATNKTVELELSSAFADDTEIFHSFLYYTLIILGVMLVVGLIYEVRTYVKKRNIQACNA